MFQHCANCTHEVMELFKLDNNGSKPLCEACYKHVYITPLKEQYEAKMKELSVVGDRLKRALERLAVGSMHTTVSVKVTCVCTKQFINGLSYAQHLDDCQGPPKDTTPRTKAAKSTEFSEEDIW